LTTHEEVQETKDQEDRGCKIVLGIIGATVGFSALAIITFILSVGAQRLPLQVIRFILTILLGILLYRGTKWAYWVLVVLYGLAGVNALVGGFLLLRNTLMELVSLATGVVYILSAVVLVFQGCQSISCTAEGAGREAVLVKVFLFLRYALYPMRYAVTSGSRG
jgi:hypothetical protein